MLELGQQLLLGPTPAHGFLRVRVVSIQRAHVPVQQVREGETATVALQPLVAPSGEAEAAEAAPMAQDCVASGASCLLAGGGGAAEGLEAQLMCSDAEPLSGVAAGSSPHGQQQEPAASSLSISDSIGTHIPQESSFAGRDVSNQHVQRFGGCGDAAPSYSSATSINAAHSSTHDTAIADDGFDFDFGFDLNLGLPSYQEPDPDGRLVGGSGSMDGLQTVPSPVFGAGFADLFGASRCVPNRTATTAARVASATALLQQSSASEGGSDAERPQQRCARVGGGGQRSGRPLPHRPGSFGKPASAGGLDTTTLQASENLLASGYSGMAAEAEAQMPPGVVTLANRRFIPSSSPPADATCYAEELLCGGSGSAIAGGSPGGGFASGGALLGRSPPNARKGTVLLAGALQPRTFWEFDALLLLLGGRWPPRGLLSGRWPPQHTEGGRCEGASLLREMFLLQFLLFE